MLTTVTLPVNLQLPQPWVAELQAQAEAQAISVDDLIRTAIAAYLQVDEPEPTHAELVADFKEGFRQALRGETRPAREVLAELRQRWENDEGLKQR